MKKSVNYENYLAKWISGVISDVELKNQVSDIDFISYLLLKDCISSMQSIHPDVKAALEKIKQKKLNLKTKRKKPIVVFNKIFVIAATFLFFFTTILSYHFGGIGANNISTFNNSRKIEIGKNVSALVYQNSLLTHNAPLYNVSEVNLKYGEVYFEVVKNQKFKIQTLKGIVEVLGTKFNVKYQNDILSVKCFEGSVKVNMNEAEFIIYPGNEFNSAMKKIQKINDKIYSNSTSELSNEEFKNVNFLILKRFMENTYNVNVSFPENISKHKFTGTLPKSDLDACIRLIASTFQFKYEVNNGHVLFKN